MAERQLPKVGISFTFNNLGERYVVQKSRSESREMFRVALKMVFSQCLCGFGTTPF